MFLMSFEDIRTLCGSMFAQPRSHVTLNLPDIKSRLLHR